LHRLAPIETPSAGAFFIPTKGMSLALTRYRAATATPFPTGTIPAPAASAALKYRSSLAWNNRCEAVSEVASQLWLYWLSVNPHTRLGGVWHRRPRACRCRVAPCAGCTSVAVAVVLAVRIGPAAVRKPGVVRARDFGTWIRVHTVRGAVLAQHVHDRGAVPTPMPERQTSSWKVGSRTPPTTGVSFLPPMFVM
jgi:hypothetical protein